MELISILILILVDPNVDGTVRALLITTIGGFATTLLTLWFQAWSTARKRKWDKIDATDLANQLANSARAQSEASHAKTRATLQAVGEMANAAYYEANQVNMKIKDLREASENKIDNIDRVGNDTNDKINQLTKKME